jgi:hypothetical protein
MSAGKVRQGGVFVEIGADAKKFFATLSQVNAQIGRAGKAMAMMGARLTAVGTAITAPIAGAAVVFAQVGDQLDKMRARTGMSAGALSELGFAAEQGGASIDTLDRALAAMARFSLGVERGVKGATDSLGMLGIEAEQFQSATPEQRFLMLAEAISRIENPSVRAGLAMQIFGRSGRELLPMLEGGAAGIEQLREEARRLGITMSDKDATAAAVLTDALNEMRRAIQAIVVAVGGSVAPLFTKMAQIISVLAGEFSKFVKENGRFVQIALAVGGAVAALGVALTTAGFAVMGISAALGALGGVMAALASPIALVVGGLAAVVAFGPQIAQGLTAAFGNTGTLIGNAANTIAGPLRVAVQDAAIVLEDLGATAGKTFQGISDAITAGNLSGAMDMLWAGLQAGWLRGTEALMSYVDPWVAFLQNTFTYLSTNVLNIWESMSSGLLQGLVTMGAFIVGVADNIVNGVIATFDAMVAAVRKSWNWVQSFIVKGYNLAEENRKVDSEMAARAAQRSQDRPGVQGRLAEASEIRKGIRGRAQDSIDARNKAADATAAGRYDRNAQLAEERRAATLAAEARVDELAAQFASEAAAVVEEREKKTASALDLGGLGDASGASQSKADIVGTFSAFAASGLGIGQNLQQKIADATKRTADAVEQMASEGALAAID